LGRLLSFGTGGFGSKNGMIMFEQFNEFLSDYPEFYTPKPKEPETEPEVKVVICNVEFYPN
jgi:hypothetical protein